MAYLPHQLPSWSIYKFKFKHIYPPLQVAYLINSNFDVLQLSPPIKKLVGTGVMSMNIYTGCLKLNNVGIFFNQTSAIGALPLTIDVAYNPNEQVNGQMMKGACWLGAWNFVHIHTNEGPCPSLSTLPTNTTSRYGTTAEDMESSPRACASYIRD